MSRNVTIFIPVLAAIGSIAVTSYYLVNFLSYVREAAVVHEVLPIANKPTLRQEVENDVSLGTLQQLISGPSYHIRQSALKIILTRFLADDVAIRGLERDLASGSATQRQKSINVLALLPTCDDYSNKKAMERLISPSLIKCMVSALVDLLPEHRIPDPVSEQGSDVVLAWFNSPVKPPHRPAQEAALLDILNPLLERVREVRPYTIRTHVEVSGLVTRWLAVYPFPCTLPINSHRNFQRLNVSSLLAKSSWGTDDAAMARLFDLLTLDTDANQLLIDAGLQAHDDTSGTFAEMEESLWRQNRASHLADPVVRLDNTLDGLDWGGLLEADRSIPRDEWLLQQAIPNSGVELSNGESQARGSAHQTAEQRDLRRQHRNAIVIAEQGQPLRPESILQRQMTRESVPENFETGLHGDERAQVDGE